MMAQSQKATTLKSRGFYTPYGDGVDREDLEQEALIAEMRAEEKPYRYRRSTIRNHLSNVVERSRRQKRYPHGGLAEFKHKLVDDDTEEKIFISQVLSQMSELTRRVVVSRMNPMVEMRKYYRSIGKPVPSLPSYVDVAAHLGVSVSVVIKSIDEAKKIVSAK